MLEHIRYINSRGEVLDFGKNGLYVNENDLRNWEWSYNTDYGNIRQFSRRASTRKLPVKVWAENDNLGLTIKNRLHDIAHADIIAGTPGRLYIGDYYMPCYITASSKSNYIWSASVADFSLTVAADKCIWFHEVETWFGQRTGLNGARVGSALVGFAMVGSDGSGSGSSAASDYTYDYPRGYDLVTSGQGARVINDSIAPCDWRIVIKGPAENPAITIGDYVHRLTYKIEDGEDIEIDSRNRTIEVVDVNGNRINIFRHRDKLNDIFTQVPTGSHKVEWNGYYLFGVTLYSERSEPLWT